MEQSNNPLFVFDFTRHLPEGCLGDGHTWSPDDYTKFENEFLIPLKSWCNEYCKKWTFQLEKGEETGKLHFQGRVSLKTKTRLSTMIRQHLGFHWSITSNNCKNDVFYVCKDETRILGPWSDKDVAPKVLPQHKVDKWFHFQQYIIDSIEAPMDTRTVNCVIDPEGNNGKSTLLGFLDHQRLACKIPFCNEFRDIMRLVMNKQTAFYEIKRCYYKCFFIDIPRAMKQDKLQGMYSAIESLKDGYVYDDRYSFKDMHFESPVVWVFMNTKPNVNYLSKDRWKFWSINDQHELVPYETNTGIKIPINMNGIIIPKDNRHVTPIYEQSGNTGFTIMNQKLD